MVTLNFQTGIAANTLLRASVHQAKWGSAQVNADVTTGSAGVDAAAAVASRALSRARLAIAYANRSLARMPSRCEAPGPQRTDRIRIGYRSVVQRL